MGGRTEYRQISHVNDEATVIHLIFPISSKPQIAGYLENLIALTPTQHLNYAYPRGTVHGQDTAYQYALVLAKIERIRENLDSTNDSIPKIYSFKKLLYVLAVGLDKPMLVKQIPNLDWDALLAAVKQHYGV